MNFLRGKNRNLEDGDAFGYELFLGKRRIFFKKFLSERWDLNPRPRRPERRALPLRYAPKFRRGALPLSYAPEDGAPSRNRTYIDRLGGGCSIR